MTTDISARGVHDPAGVALDNPVWGSLTGAHARFAETQGRGARFHRDIAPFMSVDDMHDPRAWLDLGELVGPGGGVMAAAPLDVPVPSTWHEVFSIPGVQMVDTSLRAERDPEAVELGAEDVPETRPHRPRAARPVPAPNDRTRSLRRHPPRTEADRDGR